jgi:hypothetical protein
MFLVKDRRFGIDTDIFLHTDPRNEGYKGDVIEGVELDYDMNAIHRWPQGDRRPEPRLGRDPKNDKRYKVFRSPEDLAAAAYELVNVNTPIIDDTWLNYRRKYNPDPNDLAQIPQDDWFDYLEKGDAAAKFRNKLHEPQKPKGDDRDQVAEWVAKRHMAADGGISQVWYLRSGSPAHEIRLIEISEQFTSDEGRIDPFDFGLDVDGAKYKLLIADISSDRFARIQENPSDILPKGWSLDGASAWSRRERLR